MALHAKDRCGFCSARCKTGEPKTLTPCLAASASWRHCKPPGYCLNIAIDCLSGKIKESILSFFATRHHDQYRRLQAEALQTCAQELPAAIGVCFAFSYINSAAIEAVNIQWEPAGRDPNTAWDWQEILRHHQSEPDKMAISVWCGDRLSALALALTTSQAVELRFLEGDPRGDCPIKGKRALIALDASARYAQGRGKPELRVRPINSGLEKLYKETYGFVLRSPRGEEPYWFRQV